MNSPIGGDTFSLRVSYPLLVLSFDFTPFELQGTTSVSLMFSNRQRCDVNDRPDSGW